MPVVSATMVMPKVSSAGASASHLGLSRLVAMMANRAKVKNQVRPGRVNPRRSETQVEVPVMAASACCEAVKAGERDVACGLGGGQRGAELHLLDPKGMLLAGLKVVKNAGGDTSHGADQASAARVGQEFGDETHWMNSQTSRVVAPADEMNWSLSAIWRLISTGSPHEVAWSW